MKKPATQIGRRDFLTKVTMGAAVTPMLWSAQRSGSRPTFLESAAPGAKQPLTQADFDYVGVLRVPAEVSGFSVGAMTARRVGANIRFLMTGHRYADAIFEFNGLPPASNVANAPRPSLLTAWGDVYGGKRASWQDNGLARKPSAWWTGGLCWHDDQLLWTYYDGYNVSGFDDFALGMTAMDAPGATRTYGPWRTQAGSHKSSGWVIEIPAEFGDAYCNGARIGVGAGLTSGNASSSWGTMLQALGAPTAATPGGYRSAILPTTPLVGHSMQHRQEREGNYITYAGQPEIPPSGGVGYWTQNDFLTGAIWIDLPDKHGLLFAGHLGSNEVWYGPGSLPNGVTDSCGLQTTGPHSAGREPRWWIYDPAELARVATGSLAQWDVQPSTVFDPRSIKSNLALGCPQAMAGMWFDPLTRLLYMASPGADPQPYVQTPVIHVWHVK